MKQLKPLFSHKSTSWITPTDLWEDIKDAFEIELDPCGHETETLSGIEHTIRLPDNGLEYDWGANTYINPPYSSIELWVDKAIDESKKNPKNFYVMLLPSRTDRPWFRKMFSKAIAVCFMNKRLKFSNAKNNAPFPSLIAVFSFNGDWTDEQMKCVEKYGYTI